MSSIGYPLVTLYILQWKIHPFSSWVNPLFRLGHFQSLCYVKLWEGRFGWTHIMAQFLDTNLTEVLSVTWVTECHGRNRQNMAELRPSQRRVAGVATSLPRRSQQPTYPRRCYSVAGWLNGFCSHPMIHHGWSLRTEPGGWSTSKLLGNLPLIPVKPGSFLFCLDFKHSSRNTCESMLERMRLSWDGKTHIIINIILLKPATLLLAVDKSHLIRILVRILLGKL